MQIFQPVESELLDDPLELAEREFHVLEWERAEADETIRMALDDLEEPVVDHPGELRADLRLSPVEVLRRHDRDGLDVDPHPIHVSEPDLRAREVGMISARCLRLYASLTGPE